MSRLRCYVFTVNNYTKLPDDISTDIRYLLYAEETAPTTGTPHIQGYIEFYRPEYANTIETILQALFGAYARFVPAKGTPKQQLAYISKQNNPIEFGTPAKPGTRNDLLAVKAALDEGLDTDDIAEVNFSAYVKYHKSFDRYLRSKTQPKKSRNFKTKVIYIHGTTGVGKTRLAYELYPDITPIEYDGKFFSDSPHKALFDDIDAHTFSRKLFLTLTDRYPMKIRMLGQYTNWAPEVIIFTSNYSPEDLHFDDAMLRRISETRHLTRSGVGTA